MTVVHSFGWYYINAIPTQGIGYDLLKLIFEINYFTIVNFALMQVGLKLSYKSVRTYSVIFNRHISIATTQQLVFFSMGGCTLPRE